jgi:enoyl-CoA hydratase/carnithine racemase
MSVLLTEEGPLWRLTLDRPAQRNRLDAAMAAELIAYHAHVESHDDVRVVLLDAAGDFFCYGQEGELPDLLFQLSWKVPVVAAVKGACLGAGVGMLTWVDIVVSAQGTSFGLTDMREGRWPQAYDRLCAELGLRRVRELALSGRVFSTPEALQMGLVHEAAPAFEFDDRAESIALHLCKANPEPIRRGLRPLPERN